MLRGHAIKVLDPHKVELPRAEYLAIWLDRDLKQQAKSQAKFLRMMCGIQPAPGTRGALRASYKRDRAPALRALVNAGATILPLRFEGLLTNAAGRAALIGAYLEHAGIRCNIDKMTQAVRSRPTRCAFGLEMEMMLHDERKQVAESVIGETP